MTIGSLSEYQLSKKGFNIMSNRIFQFSSFETIQDELNRLKLAINKLGAKYDESKVKINQLNKI